MFNCRRQQQSWKPLLLMIYTLLTSKLHLTVHALSSSRPKIAVVGGGASGIFASIAAAEDTSAQVTVLEATTKTLQKVKISGGGRCNVMHDTSLSVSTILSGYPRGRKELHGLFQKRFTPTMARDWFELRGVQLKTEEDGRMFPISDSSQTVVDVLMDSAENEGVQICRKHKVSSIHCNDDGSFCIHSKDGSVSEFDAVILATGSSPTGYALAKSLGHTLVKPVPSLFTLSCKHDVKAPDGVLYGLSGVSVPAARVSLSKKQFQEGPLLITHHGLSGPAALRLSAFGARDFQQLSYQSPISVHWDTSLGDNAHVVMERLWEITSRNPKRTIATGCPLEGHSIPRRLWASLVHASGIPDDRVWGQVSKKLVRQLAHNLVACPLQVTSKGTFKEEFVTAGGVSLKEVDMRTMQSKKRPGLFFCGELVDVDGVTGGFNFLNCWGTGFVAGHSAADYCANRSPSPSPSLV